jgi:histidine decarboxylase
MHIQDVDLDRGDVFSLVQSSAALPSIRIHERLTTAYQTFCHRAENFLGYQVNQDIDFSILKDFLSLHINNAGDPYIEGNYTLHSRKFEQAILEFVAHLLKVEHQDFWGYVTAGGTESNLQGLHVGRTFLERPMNLEMDTPPDPIVYFSEDTHYSIRKAANFMRLPYCTVASDSQGRIRVDALMDAILQQDPIQHPPLIVANIGTTFRGAYDDIEGIVNALKHHSIDRFYLHVDAALGGFFIPFLESLQSATLEAGARFPMFDFRLPIGSVAISGHKALGMPFPCGIFMTLRHHIAYQCDRIACLGTVDSTFSGSRNGLAPIFLWYAIASKGWTGLQQDALRMLEMANYAFKRLQEAGMNPQRNPWGLSVVFDQPEEWIVRKWSLATQDNQAHLFAMQHVNQPMIDEFVTDLQFCRQELAVGTVSGI